MSNKIVASAANKTIARAIMAAFGGRQPRITRITSDDGTFFVDVATTEDFPTKGVSSSSTIGLSDVQLYQPDGQPFTGTRIEIVSAYHSRFENMKKMLFYTSYYIQKNKWLCCPDVVLEGVMTKFGYNGDLRHFHFEEPFIWDGFENLNMAEKKSLGSMRFRSRPANGTLSSRSPLKLSTPCGKITRLISSISSVVPQCSGHNVNCRPQLP